SRLLRPRGRLVFLRNLVLVMLCFPDVGKAVETLQRAQRGVYRFELPVSGDAVGFHLEHGGRVRLPRSNDVGVQDLVDLYAPDGAEQQGYYDGVPVEWARKWPCEEIWVARKRA